MKKGNKCLAIEKLIARLKKHDRVEINVYLDDRDSNWLYYYALSGFYKNSYFSIYAHKHVDDEAPKNYVCPSTDFPDEITELLKSLTKVKFDIKQ